MSSDKQKNAGYPIPEDHQPEGTRSYCVTIPDDDGFYKALYAQLTLLGKWWLWKHNEDPNSVRAKETAEVWREVFGVTEDCGGLPMSCEDIEDCLETSATIIDINNQIITINDSVTIINEQVTVINESISDIEDCGCGGDIFPDTPPPTQTDGQANPYSSAQCNIAWYIAEKVNETLHEWWTDWSTITFQEFVEGFALGTGFNFNFVNELYGLYVAYGNPDIPDDADAAVAFLAEALFCEKLDIDAAINHIFEAEDPSDEVKNAWYNVLKSYTSGKYAQLVYAGSTTYGHDCSEMCGTWTVWYMFDDSVPESAEGDTIINGDSWSADNAHWDEGIGYTGIEDVWSIGKTLPYDCVLHSMVVNGNKNAPCANVKESVTWRGTSGTDPEAQSPEGTIISNTPVDRDWTLFDAEIHNMTIVHDHGILCGGSYGSQIHWVKLVGSGARPDS